MSKKETNTNNKNRSTLIEGSDSSLNNPNFVLEEKNSERDKEIYTYERRIGRQFTINIHPSKENGFIKVIIPYDFELKRYDIKLKEIEFYENRRYLLKKLNLFNAEPAFNIEDVYKPIGCQKLYIYLPVFIFFILAIYIALVVVSVLSFNPFVIYVTFNWIRKGYNSLRMFKFIILEKLKMKKINRILDNENKSEFCTNNKLQWTLGQSGYWLEMKKLI